MFDTIITLSDNSAIDATVFTYTDATVIQLPSTLYTVATPPSLAISTSDFLKEAVITFKITTNSRSTLLDTLTHEFTFSVFLDSSNPCLGSISVPANNSYDLGYMAHSAASILNLININNGSCTFSLSLLNAADASVADISIFTLTQPTLTPVPLDDPRIISVTTDGNISISAVNAQVAVYNLILRVSSTKSVLDTAVADVLFTVTITPDLCT